MTSKMTTSRTTMMCPCRPHEVEKRATGKGRAVRSRKGLHAGKYSMFPPHRSLLTFSPGKPPSIGLTMTWQPPIPVNLHCEYMRGFFFRFLIFL
jgi:hypothetical protein